MNNDQVNDLEKQFEFWWQLDTLSVTKWVRSTNGQMVPWWWWWLVGYIPGEMRFRVVCGLNCEIDKVLSK